MERKSSKKFQDLKRVLAFLMVFVVAVSITPLAAGANDYNSHESYEAPELSNEEPDKILGIETAVFSAATATPPAITIEPEWSPPIFDWYFTMLAEVCPDLLALGLPFEWASSNEEVAVFLWPFDDYRKGQFWVRGVGITELTLTIGEHSASFELMTPPSNTLTFDPNGGVLRGQTEPVTIHRLLNTPLGFSNGSFWNRDGLDLAPSFAHTDLVPTRTGYVFAGWNISPPDSPQLLNMQMNLIAGDFTAQALWVATGGEDITDDFTCPNLRNAVLEMSGQPPTGRVTAPMVSSIASLLLESREITSLDGIAHFTGLVGLNVSNNRLTSLDTSALPLLGTLWAWHNYQLEDVNVTGNPRLAGLVLAAGNLTSLDVSQNPDMWQLVLDRNQLTSIDVSNNPALWQLRVEQNNLTTLDVSNNPNLEWLWAWDNRFSSTHSIIGWEALFDRVWSTDDLDGTSWVNNPGRYFVFYPQQYDVVPPSDTITVGEQRGTMSAGISGGPVANFAITSEIIPGAGAAGADYEFFVANLPRGVSVHSVNIHSNGTGQLQLVGSSATVVGISNNLQLILRRNGEAVAISNPFTLSIGRPPELENVEPDTPPPPPAPVTLPDDDGAAGVDVTLDADRANLLLPDDVVENIIDEADEAVVFDLSELEGVTSAVIPTDAWNDFADAELGLELQMPAGTLAFDTDAAGSIGEQAGAANITASIAAVDEDDLAGLLTTAQHSAIAIDGLDARDFFQIRVTSGPQAITEFDGRLAVTVPFSGTFPPAPTAWRLAPGGYLVALESEFDPETGMITFFTSHLSIFVIGHDTTPGLAPIAVMAVMRFNIGSMTYIRHGELRVSDAAPFIEQDRTMIPVRVIAYGLGATSDDIIWNESAQTVTITLGGRVVSLTIGVPLPNGMGTPIIRYDRTFVPLRYVSEVLGADVRWDEVNNAVYIYQ